MVSFNPDFDLRIVNEKRFEYSVYKSGELYRYVVERTNGEWERFSKGDSELRWFPEELDKSDLAVIAYLAENQSEQTITPKTQSPTHSLSQFVSAPQALQPPQISETI